ncbi:Poliovirus receptor, partial [Cricetulus griseus]
EVAVQVLTNVTGLLGNSAYLFCSLALSGNVTVTQVTWMRKNPAGNPTKVAVFHPKKGPSIAESSRVKFLATKLDGDQWNASLSISHLSVTDEGSYECQFATFPTGSRSASVWLEVLGLLSGTFTVTSTYSSVPSSQVDGKNVTCRVKHESLTKPELKTVTLSSPCEYVYARTATGPLPNTTEPQGNQLLINTVDKATLNNVTFLCNVTNALGSGQAQKVIHVKDVEQPRLTTGAIIGIVIGVVVFVAVFIVSAVVVWRYCESLLPQSPHPLARATAKESPLCAALVPSLHRHLSPILGVPPQYSQEVLVFCFSFGLKVLEIESRALCALNRGSDTEPHPQPLTGGF